MSKKPQKKIETVAPAGNRAQKRALERSGVRNRTFSYSIGRQGEKGFVQLNFTLRTDIKDELKNFLQCIEASVLDLKEEIAAK